MNAVVYYSNTGQSRDVATYLAERLDYPLVDLEACTQSCFESPETASMAAQVAAKEFSSGTGWPAS